MNDLGDELARMFWLLANQPRARERRDMAKELGEAARVRLAGQADVIRELLKKLNEETERANKAEDELYKRSRGAA